MEIDTTLLLDRWHGGDVAALDELLAEHLDWIRARLHERQGEVLRNRAETGDYVQQTVLEFLRYGPPFRVTSGDRFRGLLLAIAENVLRGNSDWWTRRRRDLARERPLPADSVLDLDGADRRPGPREAAERTEAETWVRLGLELLAPDENRVIVLHDYDGLTHQQIGEQLGTSEEAARKRYQRAVSNLARVLGDIRRGAFATWSARESQ